MNIEEIQARHDNYYVPENNTLQGGVDAHKDRGELLDALRSVEPFLQHKPICRVSYSGGSRIKPCSCGLDEIRELLK